MFAYSIQCFMGGAKREGNVLVTSTSKDKYVYTTKSPKYADNPFGCLLVINLPKPLNLNFHSVSLG